MADLLTCEEKGVIKTVSDMPPTHYIVRLKGFSLFATYGIDIYRTAEFEVGGYKWKLILYPNGNKSKNYQDYISVNLMVVESSLPDQWSKIHAVFRVFLLDQKNDNYYTLQVANGRRFHKMKLEWGFDQFMPMVEFNDPSNGYLVDDICVLGAEVYVCKKNDIKGEQLEMMKYVNSYKHTWEIKNFYTLEAKVHYSEIFNSGGHKWKIELYPKGNKTGRGSDISVYLCLAESATLPIGSQIHAEYTISIIDQVHDNNHSHQLNYWFSASKDNYGWSKFISLTDFNALSNGYVMNDKCIIETEITIHGVTTPL